MTTIQPQPPAVPRFAGIRDVKRNLMNAALAAADAEETTGQDRAFNTGRVQAFVASAMADPAFKKVMADPDKLVNEKIPVRNQAKATLAETLKSKGMLAILNDALVENIMSAAPDGVRAFNINVPVKSDPASLYDAFMRKPEMVVQAFFKALIDNAFNVEGPMGETLKSIEGLRKALEKRLDSMGLEELPLLHNLPQPTGGAWGEDE